MKIHAKSGLRSVSNLVVERLVKEPTFRLRFQADPIQALRECGVPDEVLPAPEEVKNLDFIEMGRKIEMSTLEEAAIAVACVAI